MNLRTYVILAVFKRNFLSYFSGVIGYLFIVAFVGLGSYLAFSPQFFANNLANLDQLNRWFPMLLLFIVPAITMSAWADERKLGTDELLFTLPASDLEILLGKYFGVLGVYTVSLLFSLSHVLVLSSLGSPDWGLMFATYLGYWLVGAALLSAGMVASILTNSTTVAYVLGAMICAVPVFIDRIAPSSRLLQGLSISEQFRDFALGMVPLGGVLYFVSMTVFMLYLNEVLISRRHWSGGPHQAPMGIHFLVRSVCLGLVLVSVNVVAANVNSRIDLTHEKLYTLSPTTRDLLKEIKPERPILVQAFISPEVPRDLVPTRSTLIGLLRQYDQVGGDRVRVRIVDTEKFTDAADQAKRFGIEPQVVQSDRGGRILQEDVFMGVVVTGGVNEEVMIPFFDVGTPAEYELTRSIRTISKAKRAKLGVLGTDAKLIGGFDMSNFRQLPEWRIVTELKKQYDVKEVAPQDLAAGGFDVLLAAMPSSLTDMEAQFLVEAIKQGTPTLIIDDPFPLWHGNLAPRAPKPKAGGMFGQGPPPQPKAGNGDARQLTGLLGVAWNSGESVWDKSYDPHPDLSDVLRSLDVVYIGSKKDSSMPFSDKSPITSGLQEMMLFYPGSLLPREGSKLEFTALLRTTRNAVTLDWNDYVQSSPFGGASPIPDPELPPPVAGTEHIIAARITGKPEKGPDDKTPEMPSQKNIDVVFMTDLDMISDPFFMVREKQWQGLNLDNVTFVLNAIDELAGDESFIALRKRRDIHRTLTVVEGQTAAYRKAQLDETTKADKDAKKQLEEVKKSFDDERAKIEADTSMDELTKRIRTQTAEDSARRILAVQEANIQNDKNAKIKQSKDKSERAIRRIEQQMSWLAIYLPPIPALLLGLMVFGQRVRDERQGIVSDRLVGKRS